MEQFHVYRDGKVHVRAKKCDHCLFSAHRLVSGERARELVASTRNEEGASFICHRSQISDEPQAICSAWWDAYAEEDNIMRLAMVTGIVVRIDPEEKK